MKRAWIILIAIIAVVSCNKIKDLTNIDVDLDPYTIPIDASQLPDTNIIIPPGGLHITFPTIPITTNSQATIDKYNTTTDKINSITLASQVLQMTAPAGKYLNFLKNISVSISSDTLPSIRIAHKENIPNGITTLNLDDTSANLKKYFLQEKIYVQLSVTLDSVPPHGTALNSITTFHMQANPLN